MYLTLAAIALGAAAIGLIYAAIFSQTDEKQRPADPRLYWSLLTWTAVLGLVLFAATWPSHPPFAAGLSLGWGFLVGLVLGLYATWEARRSFAGSQWLARSAGLISAAVAGPAFILLVFRSNAADTLIGCALGAVLVAAIWRSSFAPMACREDSAGTAPAVYRGVEIFALVTCAVTVGTWLALERYPILSGSAAGAYWALPALLGAIIVVVAIILAGLATSERFAQRCARPLTAALAASVILMIGAWLLDLKLLGSGLPGVVTAVGVVGFFLVAWLAATTPAAPEEEAASGYFAYALLVVLIALAVMAVSFKVLHGFGESLALVGGLAFVAFVVAEGKRQSRSPAPALVTGGFSLVLLLAMYRVFLEKNTEKLSLTFQQHYVYFGLLLGVIAGLALLGYVQRNCQLARDEFDQLTALGTLAQRTALLGVIVAAAPLLVLIVWGINALNGFLVGLVAAEVIWLVLLGFTGGHLRRVVDIAAPHLYLAAALLVAIQFTQVMLPVTGGPRLHRGIVLAVVVLIAIIWAVVAIVRAPERPAGGEGVE